jgi:hypothetical protein
VRHVIDSSGWRSHPAGHFPGGGRGMRRRPSALHSALGYTLHWTLAIRSRSFCSSRSCFALNQGRRRSLRRVTSAKRGRWVESKRQWLGVRPISRRPQMRQRDSSAPRSTMKTRRVLTSRASSSCDRTKARSRGTDELAGSQGRAYDVPL